MKTSKKILITFIIIIVLAIIGAGIYYFINNQSKGEIKVIKKIPAYGYNLNDNETKLYKDTFDELDKILSKDQVNYEEYAKFISKLFIIDFYTLNNKISKNDIGGADFIKADMRDNFIEQARSTFYKYLEVKSNKRNQELPEVSTITNISVEPATFKYKSGEVDEDAYKVTIEWEYKEDLGYETAAKMILVKEDNKLFIVEMN